MNEAELVLTHVLNCDRLSLYLNKDSSLPEAKAQEVSSVLKRRMLGEPVQYILGSTEFMGLNFKVDKRVLIPRPETEILVTSVIEELKNIKNPRVLDIGTGSGCIAVSVAKNISPSQVTAVDISFEALEVAKENTKLNQIPVGQIKFIQSDLFLNLNNQKFDGIISNPPYVSTQELSGLAVELSFEPALALEAGSDGLDFYRRIIIQADSYLNSGGFLAFEVGMGQAVKVRDLILAQEKFDFIRIIKDYNDIQRVIIAKKRI
jgi:release factor glutamine methyltransferase